MNLQAMVLFIITPSALRMTLAPQENHLLTGSLSQMHRRMTNKVVGNVTMLTIVSPMTAYAASTHLRGC